MKPETSQLESWYGTGAGPQNQRHQVSLAQNTYKRLQARLNATARNDYDEIQDMEDIHSIVQSCLAQYTAKRGSSKARQWLSQFSSRINYYGNIMDVLVSHNPEYVALAWGAFKFLFVAVQNHESVIALLAKALSRIGDVLPRVEFYTTLYPTERITNAVEELYAQLLVFLDRAMDWCQEGTLLHILHSITRPPELQYADILERIDAISRRIDQLAITGSQAEIRAIHQKVDAGLQLNRSSAGGASELLDRMQAHEEALYEIKTQMIAFQTLNSSSAFSTNRIITDIQFSSIISSLSATALGDARDSFQYHHIMLRFQRRSEMEVVQRLGASPQLNKWSSSNESSLILVRGSFSTRHALYKLFVGIGGQLQEYDIPWIMALKSPPSETGSRFSSQVSSVDVLKHLTLQILKASSTAQTEKSVSLTCSQFHNETTIQGWLGLLEVSIAWLNRPIYIVIDLDVLDESTRSPEKFNWAEAVLSIMDHLRTRQLRAHVKVLLGGFGQGLASQLQGLDGRCPLVTIPTRKTKHAQPIGPRGGRGARGRNLLALRNR